MGRVLITGAGRGIGRELARGYLEAGWEVLATRRGAPPPPEDLPGVAWLSADVTDRGSLRALAAVVPGPLDLLVCNAGVYPDKGQPLETGFAPEVWAQAFAVNATGVFLTVQACLPALRAGRGRIAILSSAMASDARAPGGAYAYRASKAAAVNIGRNLATDLAGEGIAVGIYHPGWVRTAMGGPGAEIEPAASAAGLMARFAALGLETSGVFEDYAGRPVPF